MGEDREDLGEHEGFVAEDLEPTFAGVEVLGAVERERGVVVTQPLQALHVRHRLAWRERLGVGRREARAVLRDESAGRRTVELTLRLRGMRDTLGPRPGRLQDVSANLLGRDVGNGGAARHANRVEDTGERLGAHPSRVVDVLRAVGFAKELGNGFAHPGVVPVTRQVHHDGDEAPVVVIACEDADVAALLEAHDLGGDVVEARGRRLEQFVARVVLEDVEQVTSGVGVGRVPGSTHDLRNPLGNDRNGRRRCRVGAGRVQTEEAAFPGDVAFRVEGLHADVIEVGITVNT